MTEPTEIYAGDSVTWGKTITNYPASIWAAAYYFRNEESNFDVVGTAVGDSFVFTALTPETSGWRAGQYRWQLFTSILASGLRQFISEGLMTVKPDPSLAQPVDSRTYNEKVLAAINDLIAGVDDVEEYSIGGRSLRRRSLSELMDLRRFFAQAVAKERGLGYRFVGAAFQKPS